MNSECFPKKKIKIKNYNYLDLGKAFYFKLQLIGPGNGESSPKK